MKNRYLIYFFVGLIFLFTNCYLISQPIKIDTLSLEYGKIDSPPLCFIPYKHIKRSRIGLALSGGGARGFAQIGVLQTLEEHNIPIDIIVGVSIGSIVGGLYAVGYSPKQIQEISKSIDWNQILVDKPPRTSLFVGQKQERGRSILQIRFEGLRPAIPNAITPGQKLTSILTNLTLRTDYQISSNFDQLKIPFRALACDLITGHKILIEQGNLAEAMKASSAVPLLFAPVVKDTMLLVDGGLINNIPVDEVKGFNIDLVIGIDTVSKLRQEDKLSAPWQIADQVTTIMQREKNAEQRERADILIEVDLNNYKSDSFEQADEIITAGKQQANNYVDQINELIQLKNKKILSTKKYTVKSLNILGNKAFLENFASDIVYSRIHKSASYRDVYLSMSNIYETGNFYDVKATCILRDSLLAIEYYLDSNPILNTIIFEGNTIFSDSTLKAQIKSKLGEPINYYQSKEDIARLISLYKKNGNALVNVSEIKLTKDTLIIRIDEGIISSITITGNKRTKDYVILREFPLKAGDIFNLNKADEGINNIHSTNLYETVSLEISSNKHQAHLKIKVQEKAFNLFRLSYRYDLERKSKGMVELVDENFLGSGNQIILHGQYGVRDQIFKFKFRADRIFKSFKTTTFDLFHQQTKNFTYLDGSQIGEYLQKEAGFSFSLGQQIKRLGVFSIIAALNSIQLQKVCGYGYPTEKYELKTIALQSVVDTQDRFPFPLTGKYYLFFYKMSSAKILNSQTSFNKLFNSLELYETFLGRNTIHPKIIWGTSDLTTPFCEQYRLGGQSSFYGLRENEKIGRHIIVSSLEYRYSFPFIFPIYVHCSFRYDIGATWENHLDIKLKDFIHGIGSSIAFQTPIGPISFAWGQSSKGRNVFYFSAGFDF